MEQSTSVANPDDDYATFSLYADDKAFQVPKQQMSFQKKAIFHSKPKVESTNAVQKYVKMIKSKTKSKKTTKSFSLQSSKLGSGKVFSPSQLSKMSKYSEVSTSPKTRGKKHKHNHSIRKI
jgi:hypothetical protein